MLRCCHVQLPPTLGTPIAKRSTWVRFRIAVSVFFSLLTVAFCVHWVRSYWRCDVITHAGQQYRVFNSNSGYLKFTGMPRAVTEQRIGPSITSLGWKFGSHEGSPNSVGSRFRYSTRGWTLNFPYWAIVAIAAVICVFSWYMPRSLSAPCSSPQRWWQWCLDCSFGLRGDSRLFYECDFDSERPRVATTATAPADEISTLLTGTGACRGTTTRGRKKFGITYRHSQMARLG
jgi:hypothetical protein